MDLQDQRQVLRDEILSVGVILAEHEQRQQELASLTAEYQACEDAADKASIAMRVMDLRLAVDGEGVDAAAIEARIEQAFAEYDNALMDELIASEPQRTNARPNGYVQPEPAQTPGLAPITNKCPLCSGYKRAEFDFCRNCFMRRNPDEFDECDCGRTKHVRYAMCGVCHKEQEGIYS